MKLVFTVRFRAVGGFKDEVIFGDFEHDQVILRLKPDADMLVAATDIGPNFDSGVGIGLILHDWTRPWDSLESVLDGADAD